MAKISTYPGPSSPSISDMLIGTDVNDMNATKNFTIGDVLSVPGSTAYVPYIGAINNVNLGTYNLLTDEINPVSDIFIIQDFFQSYGGVKLDYTLGVIKYYFGDFDVRSSGLALIIDEVNSTLKIGYNNYITIDDSLNRVELSGALYTNGSVGTSGQILTSQGAGLSPTWALPNFVPYTGATGNVDLGVYDLTANYLEAVRIKVQDIQASSPIELFIVDNALNKAGLWMGFLNDTYGIGDINIQNNGTILLVDDTNERITFNKSLYVNGSNGLSGQVLTSQGTGLPPTWAAIGALAYVPYTGAVNDVDLGIYKLTADRIDAGLDVRTSVVTSQGSNFYLQDPTNTFSGLWFEYNNFKYHIGDIAFQLNGTILTVNDANNRVEFNSPIYTNGSIGTSGQLLASQGAGLPPTWTSIPSPILYHGSFYHTATITAIAPNVAYPLPVNSTDVAATNGVSIVTGPDGPTRITYANDGVYNIQFSAQLVRLSGGSTESVVIWIRKNGVLVANNIPWTSTRVDLKANQGYLVVAWNFFVEINAGDWIELCWATSDISIDIEATPSVGIYPSIPSLIITTNKVS